MEPQACCVLIPSLKPDERLPAYVRELLDADFGLVLVVDDGSPASYQHFFEEVAAFDRCHVLHHEVNRGKGAALKTGFRYLLDHTGFQGVITADSDGQHTVPDTLKLASELGEQKELLLGSRDFSKENHDVPFKSRFGNRITSAVFRLFYGQWLPDTQTGLRAFSRDLLSFMTEVEGDRFEYEMCMLIKCRQNHIPIRCLTIETIYHDDNKGTSFHPVRDSWKIYKKIFGNFFQFVGSSIISWAVDILLFSWLKHLSFLTELELTVPLLRTLSISSEPVLLATAIARFLSATLNFLLNKNLVFRVREVKGAVWRYVVLCIGVMLVSGVTVSALHALTGIDSSAIKIVVDFLLFFVNYRIQKAWVFPQEKKGENA